MADATPTQPVPKLQLNIQVMGAENGFVININSRGAMKQFIAKDIKEVQSTLSDFVQALGGQDAKTPAG